jgi:hypothetical protein
VKSKYFHLYKRICITIEKKNISLHLYYLKAKTDVDAGKELP